MKVPKSELTDRMSRFVAQMDNASPDWEIALIFAKIVSSRKPRVSFENYQVV